MNKTAASAAQFARCLFLLIHVHCRTTVAHSCASTNKNIISLI